MSEVDTVDTVDVETTGADAGPARPAPSPVLTWAGIALGGLGFVLILVAWGVVAGETEVHEQVPALIAAGFGGLGLLLVGLLVVNLSTTRQDEHRRAVQVDQLTQILAELRDRRR